MPFDNPLNPPSPESLKKVADLVSWPGWTLARALTEDELNLFAAALDAGAVMVPRLLRDYLAGASCCPFQFELCWVHAEDMGDPEQVERGRKYSAMRDGFYERVRSGDLAAVVARIDGASTRKAAA
jgi:hypothetical protein